MAREHTHATEALIIISQTFFLVFFFVFLKKSLVDNRKMMANRRVMRKNALQLAAIFFSIIVLLVLLTIPLWNYAYAEIIMLFVLVSIAGILIHDIKHVTKGQGVSEAPEEESDSEDEGTKKIDTTTTTSKTVINQLPIMKETEINPIPARELVRFRQQEKKPDQNQNSLFNFDMVKSAFGVTPKKSVQKQVSYSAQGLDF